jgi:cytochrome c oxidase subunit IV
MTAAVDTHAEAGQAADHAHGEGAHWTDKKYVMVAIYLAILTGIEVGLSYLHVSGATWLPTVLLCVIMVVKFVTVALFFMHLRFDDKWFGRLFWTGLILALSVYLAALTTFQIWAKS